MSFGNQDLFEEIRGIKGYVDGLRSGKRPEYGYLYNNDTQYSGKLSEYISRGKRDQEIEDIFVFLKADLDEVERRKENPIRSDEEQAFYGHIVGINSYIRECGDNYTFDNVPQTIDPDWPDGCLLNRLEALHTEDSDILGIMHNITVDIKKTIADRQGLEAAEEFQERLTALHIGIPALQK